MKHIGDDVRRVIVLAVVLAVQVWWLVSHAVSASKPTEQQKLRNEEQQIQGACTSFFARKNGASALKVGLPAILQDDENEKSDNNILMEQIEAQSAAKNIADEATKVKKRMRPLRSLVLRQHPRVSAPRIIGRRHRKLTKFTYYPKVWRKTTPFREASS